jgi:hydroxymethylpyrimidine pyrophosphatase-like HAD family hydrolase/adenine/guanine phosphoribosyltransferase-like PRPP-binding protein
VESTAPFRSPDTSRRPTDLLPAEPGPLLLPDLLLRLDEVLEHLGTCLRSGHELDAFLLSAAAVQIVEDVLQRDPLSLRRAAKFLGGPVATALGGAARVVELGQRWSASRRRSTAWCADAGELRDACADAVVADGSGFRDRAGLLRAAAGLAARRGDLDHVTPTALMRLPACFRGHDLLPEDAVTLAERYACTLDDGTEVLVVGIRTSGSYLAPLVAAALRARGMRAPVLSSRPGHPLFPADADALRTAVSRGARVVIVDDAPRSGASLRRTADLVRDLGVPVDAVTLLVPLFGDESPAGLADLHRVELPYREWTVHRLLEPAAVGRALAEIWGVPVVAVEQAGPAGTTAHRHHVEASVLVRTADGREHPVVAAGAGAGFLGRHALAVARALPGHVVATHGFRDGLVFRRRMTSPVADAELTPADVDEMARYVRERAAVLPADVDRAVGLAGREPVWELAARLLSAAYGRLGVLLRLPFLDQLIQDLCAVDEPSIVDGSTGLGHWFRDGATLRKNRADDLAFGNWDRACYDRIYDLAGIAPGAADGDLVRGLRAACPSDPERYLLYELVHLQEPATGRPSEENACSRAVLRYLAEREPPPPPADGPLCALDLDGVLETRVLGFSAPTPTAWRAVRALGAHGYRAVPVTGRSLAEVRDRCTILGLAGGVAEYGSVVYDHRAGRALPQVEPADLALLDLLRSAVAAVPHVEIDDGYRFGVRARHVGDDGRIRALPPAVLDAALARVGTGRTRVRVIPGRYQTDIVAAGVTKGTGLRALAAALGDGGSPAPMAMAIGDSDEDLPMLRIADAGFAPANATPGVRGAGIEVLNAPFAAGVEKAAGRVLGHRPGRCAVCRPAPVGDPGARALMAVLDAPRSGRRGLPRAAVRLGVAARALR